jgi:ubiquinone/menaquinone biosynthesis C-methylase UbiE
VEKDYPRALGPSLESHGVNKAQEIPFDNSGDFLNWWFEARVLTGKALEVFERYYSHYRLGFDGYLKKAWAEKHLELEMELESIDNKSNIKILDLGCGTGSVALYIASKFGEKCDVFGLDINEDRLLCARERQKVLEEKLGYKLRCRYIASNVLSLNEECKFDLIYLEETLHHMEQRL